MTRCEDFGIGNRANVPNACPEFAPSDVEEPLREDRFPIRVQTLDVPETGVRIREMSADEKFQVNSLVRCGLVMWVVLTLAAIAFALVGISEVALYGTGFSFTLPGLFLLWMVLRMKKEYWEAASVIPLWKDAREGKVAVVVAVSPEINAHLEILPRSLYLWSVDGQVAPWRELRLRRDVKN